MSIAHQQQQQQPVQQLLGVGAPLAGSKRPAPPSAFSSAIDEGERDAADEGQPAAAGKRKRKSLKRKSSAARQNDNHGKRNDGAGGNH